jgi:hypothetical protein
MTTEERFAAAVHCEAADGLHKRRQSNAAAAFFSDLIVAAFTAFGTALGSD